MLKPIVIYYSKTGNTRKVARAIAESLNITATNVDKVENIWEYNLIIVGTPVHMSKPAKKIRKFLKSLPSSKGKYGGAFCTMLKAGSKKTNKYIQKKMEDKGIEFLESFSTVGESGVHIAGMGPDVNKNRPNEEDLKSAKEFGKKISDMMMKKEIEGKTK